MLASEQGIDHWMRLPQASWHCTSSPKAGLELYWCIFYTCPDIEDSSCCTEKRATSFTMATGYISIKMCQVEVRCDEKFPSWKDHISRFTYPAKRHCIHNESCSNHVFVSPVSMKIFLGNIWNCRSVVSQDGQRREGIDPGGSRVFVGWVSSLATFFAYNDITNFISKLLPLFLDNLSLVLYWDGI